MPYSWVRNVSIDKPRDNGKTGYRNFILEMSLTYVSCFDPVSNCTGICHSDVQNDDQSDFHDTGYERTDSADASIVHKDLMENEKDVLSNCLVALQLCSVAYNVRCN